jgi:hypothetical protein
MLETTGYYYKDTFRLKHPDVTRRIVDFLFAFTAID